MTITSPKPTRSSLSPRAMDASAKPRPKLLAALRKPAAESSESDTESENGTSASEDEAPTPTASAQPLVTSRPQPEAESAHEDGESDGEAAYERMKKRLAASKNSTESQTVQKAAPVVAPVVSSEDEDEMPVRTKARTSNAKRAKTASPPASPSPSVRSRRSSPGLFVTPNASPAKKQPRNLADTHSESDESSQPLHNADLQERVRRIRAERLAKQQEEQAQGAKSKKTARRRADHGSGSETDGENGRRLTQQAKPTRKAGKKAMEAMARDQQRISRNMQLTHQAKTKKRFTTKDLFAKMGFNVPGEAGGLPTPDASSALASSDAEAMQIHDTPPTSPPKEEKAIEKDALPTTTATAQQDEDQLPTPTRVDKGKGRAPEFQHLPLHPWMEQSKPLTVRNATVNTKKTSDDAMVELSDSDDDIQIVQSKSRFPVFDRLPTKTQSESSSLLRLRSLAQLAKSPKNGKKGQHSVTLAEMEFSLAQKARQQANEARESKIAEMLSRGHVVETEEEREKRQEEIEDMVAQFEKQRQEDRQLAKLEREEAKKNGETLDDLPSSDESDGDYVGSGEENANEEAENGDEAEIELSGSEDEEMEGDEDAEEGDLAENSNGLIDEMADEDDEPEEAAQLQQIDEDADMEDEDTSAPIRKQTGNRARNRVIQDEDESDTETPKSASPTQPSTQDNAMAAFGFGNADPGLGLTQVFAGTMAELESGSQSTPTVVPEPEQDSLDFLRSLPDTQPGANFSQTSDFVVPNSQSLMTPKKESQTGPESQFSLGISQLINKSPAFSRTQLEDFEPTQDAGFSFSRSPAGLAPPPSTTDTVMVQVGESPIKQKKGKLQRRRRDAAVELSDADDDLVEAHEELSEDDIQLPPKPKNAKDAFSKLQKAAKKQKAIDDFNKKTSMAKDAVMEQAEESEDEYAGLGGASDDEEGEEDQELKDMIDHNDVNVDERQLAAFYADKAKKEDEKNIADLYKKIQTGGLRRHGGGQGFDMSDSEDEAELRQRKKRAEFQKQTRALLTDERVKEISKDEKKKAFFNTLADFADEGDYDFLDMPADIGVGAEESQSQEEAKEGEGMEDVIPDSQAADTAAMPAPANPLKRKSPDFQKENRPPPNMRRTAASDNLTRKPITLADVQNSVSELLEDSRIMVPDSQFSESEDDDDTPAPNAAARKPIVDRLTLSRTSSISESAAADSNLAFHAPSRSSNAPGFRVPSLIRQATSNLSTTSQKSSGANTPTESVVRRGGTGRSNIHAQAREAERRALLDKKDGKRKEALRKKVEGGRKRAGGMRSVLGDLGGGFE